MIGELAGVDGLETSTLVQPMTAMAQWLSERKPTLRDVSPNPHNQCPEGNLAFPLPVTQMP